MKCDKKCAEIREVLEQYLDDALDNTMQRAVRGHLENCPPCRQESVTLRRLDNLTRAALATETPLPAPELWSRVMATLDTEVPVQREQPERGRLVLFGGLAALAATVAGVGVVGYALRRSDVLPVWLLEAPVEDWRTFLASDRAVDIATVDPERLLGWFSRRLSFQPPPPPPPGETIKLVGGRLCYFLHRRAASYMYRTEGKLVSLFAFNGAGLGMPEGGEEIIAGRRAVVRRVGVFTHILWSEGPLIRSLVSDMPRARLARVMTGLISNHG